MKKRWWIIGIVVVLVGGLGYGAFRLWRGISLMQSMAEMPATENVVVRRDTLLVTVGGTGNLAPQAEMSLLFTSGGWVTEVLVEAGQVVETGQPLIQLETVELALQVRQAEAGLASAQAQLAKLLTSPSPEELALAEIDLQNARDALDQAQAAYDRVSWRPEISMLPQSANLEKATEDYQRALISYRLAVQGPSDEDITIAEASITQAEVSLEQARMRLEQATLVAPMAGTVTALNVQPGDMASAGQAVVVVSDLEAMEVSVKLDETDVIQVAAGLEVQIVLDVYPDVTLDGEVTYIAPVAQTQSGLVLYPITVRLLSDAQGLAIRSGMTAEVDIVVASRENVLIVPLRAVQSMGENHFVLRRVPEGESPAAPARPAGGVGRPVTPSGQAGPILQFASAGFEAVPVTLGLMTDTEVEITSGLQEGDEVSVVLLPSLEERGIRFRGPMGGVFGGVHVQEEAD